MKALKLENSRLKKLLAEKAVAKLKMERDIVIKAAAHFA